MQTRLASSTRVSPVCGGVGAVAALALLAALVAGADSVVVGSDLGVAQATSERVAADTAAKTVHEIGLMIL
ncbi:hypothetical protein AKJ09_00299 [Labilithrix luteola]|uniref:Uncharacterized protein n=1 Tax=Labilithrix luteola TaxID=1391654 RepID=A0A0K1PJD5_9BACT|nr:hypothetical protein AKJ09_00299 [Labilithrix luteola]